MRTKLNKRMGDEHEGFLVSLFGGRQSRGSGNQWRNPMDGRTSRKHLTFAFAWDGKSTLAKSIGVSLAMWDKAREQAGGERPMLALRFYKDESLKEVYRDLVVVDAHVFAELLEAANAAPVSLTFEPPQGPPCNMRSCQEAGRTRPCNGPHDCAMM